MRGLSLFANVGIAETFFEEEGIDIVVANELLEDRANFYRHLYPNCSMIHGSITDENVYNEVIEESMAQNIDFILATPPCQGMSLNGNKDPNDVRNELIKYVISAIKELDVKCALIENVPQQLKTKINHKGKMILIPDFIKKELGNKYIIKTKILNSKNFNVPQSRSRVFVLIYKKNSDITWDFPTPSDNIITLNNAIGHIPTLKPMYREKEYRHLNDQIIQENTQSEQFHIYHKAPTHSQRHIHCMSHTISGKSAFTNIEHYPKTILGKKVSGGAYSYMRMSWDKPAPTVTQNNGVISSFTNVHPGRELPNGNYSDPRVLTILELLIVSSIPIDWNIPDWASDRLIRKVIGEAVPPNLTRAIVGNIRRQ